MTGYLQPPPIAFAHRGGSKTVGNEGIENSLAAFAHAYAMGYRYLETDVRCSADGIVYAFHDKALDRLTGSIEQVKSLTAASIDLILLDRREPIPRLEALFEAFPDARLNIDVKSEDAIGPTCDLIRRLGVVDRACLSSFSHGRLTRIRRRLPDVTTSASVREVACAKLLPTPLLRLLARPRGQCLQVPARSNGLPLVTRRFVRRAHALGLQIHVWSIDDEAEINRLLDLGVDGIMTDRTDVLKDVLVSRGTWREPA